MEILVLLLLMATPLFIEAFPEMREPKERAQRRQQYGYSNSIIHENPYYQDSAAQSSVKVNFNNPSPTINQAYIVKKSPNYHQNTQLFNVGYSVKFTNAIQAKPKARINNNNNNLEEGEIITGTRKENEQVEGPHIEMSPQDFVQHALIDSKKHKISGIKPKTRIVSTNYPNPKTLLNQANLSPITQKYYKAIEQTKPQIPNTQDLQQRYSWRNLSPSVEIIRSTEIPSVNQKFPETNFDHVKAIGRSQEFDYTNALDNNNNNNNYYSSSNQYSTIQHQLPMDTTLLREPIQVQVDTRYLDEAMKQHFFNSQQQETYLQGQYRTLPQSQIQEPQAEQSTRYQYKVYGKPQPVQIEQNQRQPRYIVANLQTNLRPPPPISNYQRRILIVN